MNTKLVLLGTGLLLILAGIWWWQDSAQPVVVPVVEEDPTEVVVPDAESAEITAFAFIQDVVAVAPGNTDPTVAPRLYETLSESAKAQTSVETIVQDIALFVGIQDVPDQGVSVEDLQMESATRATLIVGLNYSDGRTLRAIHLVVEEGEWKVDSVEALEIYPPETSIDPVTVPPKPVMVPPVPGPNTDPKPVVRGECYVGGCSSQVCSDNSDIATTCEWREEYACYKSATCERQATGECGWTQTTELAQCLAKASE